ncbi:hypothetical protein GA0061098_1004206 [Bradyrhizobium shewense]|uniref:Methyltransferase domain-containing protein n=1 Tax=Bradyrhizobium shewense TaxID=1761772 RepID=A0A1C3VGJ7_9BRAD|nr:hypothetical protein [Bradyrhizobium shewense]SCB26913.1 hypothetical protein GA0061098_1004206 [Bradyrhizobium shewense]
MSYSLLTFSARKQLSRLGTALRGGVRPEFEAVYQRIFDRDIERLGIVNDFYPVSSAANYSLMYLISRLVQSFQFQQIVELGAGQTTLLIDAFKKRGIFDGSAITVEHDNFWRNFIQEKVGHELKLVPLSGSAYAGGYDFAKVEIPSKIELLLIDGPPAFGSRYLSRHSALPLVELLNHNGFVIVIDDAERRGESELAKRIADVLSKKHLNYRIGDVLAAKRQTVIASGKFESAAFF